MAHKSVLGKGLASLLPGAAAPATNAGTPPAAPVAATGTGATAAGPATTVQQSGLENKDRHPGISLANPDDIVANTYQPRRDFDDSALEELAQSIRSNGIIQPLVVRRTANGYELIAGERRLRAAKLAGLKQVPIVIRRSTDRESLELALIENIQRQNLNCIDEALAYHQLMQDFSLTQEEVARRVGKDRTTVSNFVRLLRLPEVIITDLKQGTLSFGHGKTLLGLDDNEARLRARLEIIDRKLSVRDTEVMIERMKLAQAGVAQPVSADATPKSPTQARLANLAQELTRTLSSRVEIKGSEKRGKIVLHYSSRQELDRILASMQNDRV